MQISIRKFLLVNLLMAMTITISLTAMGNYYLDKEDIENHLDSLLSQAGLSFTAIASHDIRHQNWKRLQERMNAVTSQESASSDPDTDAYHYHSQYRYQIWGPDHELLLRAANTPSTMLSDGKTGFNDRVVGNLHYRVFTNRDSQTQLTFVVAEPYYERDRLAHHIMVDDLYIMLLTYPLSGFLIWIIIGRGLASVQQVASELKHRAPSYLEPVSLSAVPIEIKPLIEELNKLFNRLKNAFEREKRFASDAAHELRTPLAAIRTQAQVALIVAKTPEQLLVLQNVIQGVDRATHIVNQLLAMSRLMPDKNQLHDIEEVNVSQVARAVVGQLSPMATEKEIELKLDAPREGSEVMGNVAAIQILIRNLVDNAIRYSKRKNWVHIKVIPRPDCVELVIADNGPGVPKEYRERIFERFFRMLGNEAPGSGLGLSIVRQIVDMHQAKLQLKATDVETDAGLTVVVYIPLELKIV